MEPVDIGQLRMTSDLFGRTRDYLLRDERERICFLFGRRVTTGGDPRVVISRLLAFSDDCYVKQEGAAVVLRADAKNHVYHEFCRTSADTLINCHSHPFTRQGVRFSAIDDADDRRESAYLYSQVPAVRSQEGHGADILAVSLVFGQESVDARSLAGDAGFGRVRELVVLGESLEVLVPTSEKGGRLGASTPRLVGELYDRQRDLVGDAVQERLARLRVGLVGVGGVGSVLVEGLGRLGFRRLVLVDGDELEESNLNRWLGGKVEDLGLPKVEVAAQRLREMFPGIAIEEVATDAFSDRSVAALKGCDLILGAIDNHLARYFLNRLAIQYLVPYLDGATRVYREPDGRLRFASRVAVVLPGASACLNCSQIQYLDGKEVARALYDPATQERLRASGYMEDSPENAELSILPLNSCLASLVLLEGLNLFSAWRPTARSVSFDWNASEAMCGRGDAVNFPERPQPGCLDCSGYLAAGDSERMPMPRGLDEANHGTEAL